ncbi:MAG TPA: hypothetical protein VGN07_03385 [Steroidobacteraceae bacterium]
MQQNVACANASPIRLASVLAVVCIALAGCHRTDVAAPATDEPAAEAADEAKSGVALSPEEIEKIGITTSAAAATTYMMETGGYGVVLAHDAIAQAVADVVTGEAAERQSRAALARVKGLAGTPGAFSAEIQEATERQVAADAAALTLAKRKLSASFGEAPWHENHNSTMLEDLASGRSKLVRATFPLGTLTGSLPHNLRISRPDPSGTSTRWKTDTVWAAPADATIPGRSLFALLKNSDAGEGERLDVWAAVGTAQSGLLIPQAAVVLSDGKSWCYVEKPAGHFARIAVDTVKPTAGGYFVTEGILAGDPVVVSAAGLLLARETNPDTEAE